MRCGGCSAPGSGRSDGSRLVGASSACLTLEGVADVYELFCNGTRLLEQGDFHAAAVPLTRARELEPDKDWHNTRTRNGQMECSRLTIESHAVFQCSKYNEIVAGNRIYVRTKR